jgi:hypothetical protein
VVGVNRTLFFALLQISIAVAGFVVDSDVSRAASDNCWKQKMLIDVKKKRNEKSEQAKRYMYRRR